MKEAVRVNTVHAKNRLNELLAGLEKNRQPVVVERRGKPVAVFVDYASYESREGKPPSPRKNPFLAELTSFHKRMRKKYPHGTGDSVEILCEMREQRHL